MHVEIKVAVRVEEVAILLIADDRVRRQFRRRVREEPGSVVQIEHRPAVRSESTAGAAVAEEEIKVTVVVDVGELAPRRRKAGGRQTIEVVTEEAVSIVDEQHGRLVEVVGEDHVPVAVTIDVAELDTAIPTDDRHPGFRFIDEETIAVVDIDPRPKRRALGGIALTVGERDVKVAVLVDVAERQLVAIERLGRKTSRRSILKLLRVRDCRTQNTRGDDQQRKAMHPRLQGAGEQ